MISKLIADALIIVHLFFILFVLLGGLLVLKWQKIALLHLPCVLWGALLEFYGWICPLTPLENYFRESGGASRYTEGFIDHYIIPLIYPSGLDRNTQVVFGIIVITVNIIAYALVLRKQSNKRKS